MVQCGGETVARTFVVWAWGKCVGCDFFFFKIFEM